MLSSLRRAFALFCLLLLLAPAARADEGMWLPLLLKSLNEADMQAKGLRLKAEDIFAVNKSSLKDAVVQFGGGCTGELISAEGLLLTNHHCGFSAIQQHSSVEKDYLTNGYWAKSRAEELPNPGLTAMFIIRMEDVTARIIGELPKNLDEAARETAVQQRIAAVSAEATKGTHYGAIIRPFFYGQEYYLFVTETFTDVRMVGAPPSGIGKFGSDTDNWVWPRHTGDFSLFRIYAAPDGTPAPYSAQNVPFKPRHFLPISLAPVQEGDFTMVYGFPGRTQQYLTSWAVDELVNVVDPIRVSLRDARLKRWDVPMKTSDRLRIAYSAKYNSLANYWKKWIGEMRGLKANDVVSKKREQETTFRTWAAKDGARQAEYGTALAGIEQNFKTLEGYSLAREYFLEGTMGVELFSLTQSFGPLAEVLMAGKSAPAEAVREQVEKIRKGLPNYYKNYDAATDQLICADLLAQQARAVPAALLAPALREAGGANGDFTAFAERVFRTSGLPTLERANKMLDRVLAGDHAALLDDPAYKFASTVAQHYRTTILPTWQKATDANTLLSRAYLKGLREMQRDRKFYPDANSTLRVAYGNVSGSQPADGQRYVYYTTLDGVMEKADSTNEDYRIPRALANAYKRRDFGPYTVNGTVPVAFIATNHTTGGNSGSPILNGRGELMGLNFDRIWEGTMSDVYFDPAQCRNIGMDMHYLLFVIDKVGGAGQLIKEMKLVSEPHPNPAVKEKRRGKRA